jgi:hypothetical protein
LLQSWEAANSRQIQYSSPPDDDDIEEELIHAFRRLDLQVMTVVDDRPKGLHHIAKTLASDVLSSMPLVFTSIREAHNYWEIVMRRGSHFLHSVSTSARISNRVSIFSLEP